MTGVDHHRHPSTSIQNHHHRNSIAALLPQASVRVWAGGWRVIAGRDAQGGMAVQMAIVHCNVARTARKRGGWRRGSEASRPSQAAALRQLHGARGARNRDGWYLTYLTHGGTGVRRPMPGHGHGLFGDLERSGQALMGGSRRGLRRGNRDRRH